jgi:hypothetical protein
MEIFYGTDVRDVENLALDVLFQLTFILSRREEGVRFRRKIKLICSECYKMGPRQSRDAIIIKGSQIHEHLTFALSDLQLFHLYVFQTN